MSTITVAIPTLDAGPEFGGLLDAVVGQSVSAELEIVVCDSGSRDRTVEFARSRGARVIEIDRREFSHGGTRNRLMRESRGEHVAFLTQDARPAGSDWLAQLVAGFVLAPDVGLVFGPYLPRADASAMVARELGAWFESFAAPGEPRIDRLPPNGRDLAPSELYGHRGYFTDANGCLARSAWEQVPFREVAYAEDHLLAIDMLRAGFAKAYLPGAAVIHSHDYPLWGWLRRSFDETRATREVYGIAPGGEPRAAIRNLRGGIGADWRAADRDPRALADAIAHHGARGAGAVLGARAGSLPPRLRALLSLEGRR